MYKFKILYRIKIAIYPFASIIMYIKQIQKQPAATRFTRKEKYNHRERET